MKRATPVLRTLFGGGARRGYQRAAHPRVDPVMQEGVGHNRWRMEELEVLQHELAMPIHEVEEALSLQEQYDEEVEFGGLLEAPEKEEQLLLGSGDDHGAWQVTPEGEVIPSSRAPESLLDIVMRNRGPEAYDALLEATLLPYSEEVEGKSRVDTSVHGTWAKGAKWTRETTPETKEADRFQEVLATQEDGVQHSSDWSGDNSDSARREGGEKLAAELFMMRRGFELQGKSPIHPSTVDTQLPTPSAPSLSAIGHSHGGNVVHIANDILGDDGFAETYTMGTPNFVKKDAETGEKTGTVYQNEDFPGKHVNYYTEGAFDTAIDPIQTLGAKTLSGGGRLGISSEGGVELDDGEKLASTPRLDNERSENVPVKTNRVLPLPGAHTDARHPMVARDIVQRRKGIESDSVNLRDSSPDLDAWLAQLENGKKKRPGDKA